jgi:very-short-patch-repair endonuclease
VKQNNIERCKKLRKNQTDAEGKLWSILRNRQLESVKFRRQHSIDKYILDFYSSEHKLGIEADGGQHYDENGRKYDEERANVLSRYGVEIIRFNDLDILNNIEGVYETIQSVIKNKKSNPPHLNPLPLKGERKSQEDL